MDDTYSNRLEYIVGIDIGSQTAKCMVGELSDECNLKVIDAHEIEMAGSMESESDIQTNAHRIRELVKRIEDKTGLRVYTVYVTVGRGEIKGLNMTGSLVLDGARITHKHKRRVLKSAERFSIPHGLEIVHTLPQKYYLDKEKWVIDPIGFTAQRLDVEMHAITCDSKSLNLKRRIMREAGYYIEGLVVDSLASFYGSRGLYSREKDVLIINVGSTNTDILFCIGGQIMVTTQIRFGINDITNEFEYRFGIVSREAHKLLLSYIDYCSKQKRHTHSIDASRNFVIVQKKVSQSDNGYYNEPKKISERTLSLVISYMVSQMIEKTKSSIIAYLKGNINEIQVVLMGGGSQLPEMEREFTEKFGCEIIQGENKLRSGGDLFGTAYGLLRYGIEDRKSAEPEVVEGFFNRIRNRLYRFHSWATVRLS